MNIVIGCTVGCAYCYARNNVKRWHMIDDFTDPEFFPDKLRMMEKKRPQNFLLTGMSDLSGWKQEWRDEVFAKIRENPQHQFLFLTKRPDLLDFDTELENAWFGVTVTRKAELWRIDALRKNIRAKHDGKRTCPATGYLRNYGRYYGIVQAVPRQSFLQKVALRLGVPPYL